MADIGDNWPNGERDERQRSVIVINVTDPDGILLGRFPLASDELRSPEWIGRRVIEELPAHLRPEGS
jgi:hypothetical protein